MSASPGGQGNAPRSAFPCSYSVPLRDEPSPGPAGRGGSTEPVRLLVCVGVGGKLPGSQSVGVPGLSSDQTLRELVRQAMLFR